MIAERFISQIEENKDDEHEEDIIERINECLNFLEPYKEFTIYNC